MSKISVLEVYDVENGTRKTLHEFEGIIEAPNWLQDGDTILYNADGRIWKYSISEDSTQVLDTGFCTSCNNDHVPSPDNLKLAVSCASPDAEGFSSHIYIIPMEGGAPRKVSEKSPSFLHGWSWDGKELAYCSAFRGDDKVDICVIPADGGEEKRLTDGVGYNDGPEYSPDDKHIWFNSTRNGLMQIYRMDRDGSNLTQMTDTDSNNWFAHISPDGRQVVWLVFRKGELSPWEHVPDRNVELWMMDYDGGNKHRVVSLFGGQGTINVNSWSPDSRKFAFVSYRYE